MMVNNNMTLLPSSIPKKFTAVAGWVCTVHATTVDFLFFHIALALIRILLMVV